MHSRRIDLLRGVAAASLCASLACSPTTESRAFPDVPEVEEQPTIAERFGIFEQLAWGSSPEAVEVRRDQIARLKSLGVQRVRVALHWHELERAPGEWDFEALDPVIEDVSEAGLQLLGVLGFGNPIHANTDRGDRSQLATNFPTDPAPEFLHPPTNAEDFARYVRAVVDRYGPLGVKEYELWSQPNAGLRFWRPQEDVDHYLRIANTGALAGKFGCSDCTFAIGGLAMAQPVPSMELFTSGTSFLRSLYWKLPYLTEVFHSVGFHPYQYPKDPPEAETAPFEDRVQGSLATQARELREVMTEFEGELPLWITESGWPTNPEIPESTEDLARVFGLPPSFLEVAKGILGEDFGPLLETLRGVSEEEQAQYVVRGALIATSLGIERIVHRSLDDLDVENEINEQGAFGLYRLDRSEKPAAQAVRTLLKRFGDYRFAGDVTEALGLEEPSRALAFRADSRILLALWRWKEGPVTLDLQGLPGPAEIFDLRGDGVDRVRAQDPLRIVLGPEVTYLEVTH